MRGKGTAKSSLYLHCCICARGHKADIPSRNHQQGLFREGTLHILSGVAGVE